MTYTYSETNPQQIIICGGGVIGACIAYYLSRHPKRAECKISVVERTGVANASSGKSGGFLALDWCRGTPVDALARRSFALHAELAATLGAELDLEWGYRPIDTLSVVASEARDLSRMGRLPTPGWLGETTAIHSRLGDVQTTAQIDPAAFTRSMMQAAEAEGVKLREGTVEGVVLADDGKRITGVQVDGEITAADAVVIAMGPWSILAAEWLALPPVYGLKGHSLVFRFEPADPSALFVEVEMADGAIETPEVVPRVDGTTYICGLSGTAPLPADPADVTLETGASERLRAMAMAFSPQLGAAEVIAEQACYRPITTDGIPIIGHVPNVEGAYVATGHSVWGMLNGPATGEAMAELILDGATTYVDLTPFAPGRLRKGQIV
ncbi:MAG: FAD-binding oxidoreductase [Caldilineaceae bacterium]|nr:FAD-binding oxidoreductase [Caldilineaceae bacterium]